MISEDSNEQNHDCGETLDNMNVVKSDFEIGGDNL